MKFYLAHFKILYLDYYWAEMSYIIHQINDKLLYFKKSSLLALTGLENYFFFKFETQNLADVVSSRQYEKNPQFVHSNNDIVL